MLTNDQLEDPYENLTDALEQLVAAAINDHENSDPRAIVDQIRELGDADTAHAEVEDWLAAEDVDAYEAVATHMLIDATDDEIAVVFTEFDAPVA